MMMTRCATVLLGLGALAAAAGVGTTEPLFVSEYLPDRYELAQNLSRVEIEGWEHPSHAGLLTIDAPTSSNTFFWFLPALSGDADAPVLLWLQGGPGASSLFGMFSEIGPFNIGADLEPVRNPVHWNQNYSLLFFDNPIGVGFSFTQDASRLVTNMSTVGSDLRTALLQFFTLFPEQRANDFYVTGESYGGKYTTACAHAILRGNADDAASARINLRGLSIGDGAVDPAQQFSGYGATLLAWGMISADERAVFDAYDARVASALAAGDALSAFAVFDEMLNGDFFPYPTYYTNATGLTNYFNLEQGDCGASCDPAYFEAWLNTPGARDAIHVGGATPYASYNASVELALKGDWMVGVLDMLVPVLEADGVKVQMYAGTNDLILGPPPTARMLDSLDWSGAATYASAPKTVWRVEGVDEGGAIDPIAGYCRSAQNFTFAVVRGAGHMVPTDQPQRALDLITRFVDGRGC